LVNAIQYLLKEWSEKPAAIVSYGGVSAGLRASQMLRLLLTSVNVMPLAGSVPIPFFPQFIVDGNVFRATEQVNQGAMVMFNELHRWAFGLRHMRDSQ